MRHTLYATAKRCAGLWDLGEISYVFFFLNLYGFLLSAVKLVYKHNKHPLFIVSLHTCSVIEALFTPERFVV